jgi:hypothetical protein
MLLVAGWLGCTPDPAVTLDKSGTGDSGTTPGTDTESPTTSDSTATGDLALVLDLVEGRAAPEDVIPAVAWSGGWPVADGDAVWVVAWSDQGPWAVAGDPNGWTPQDMEAGDGFFYARLEVGGDPAGLKYKLVHGADWLADPWARSYDYDQYGEISYLRPPTDAPRLDRWPGIAGAGLEPRDLRVWVPAGEGPWPVLYAHDGQNLFDPNGIYGGWRLQDALATRDPVLVVGIDNTPARMDEYTHVPDDIGYGYDIGGAGDAYASLVEDHVRPHVEATYGSTGLDGLMGSSLGGLISLYVAQQAPGRYDFAASLSGTLGWGRLGLANPTIEELWLAAPPTGLAVYVDSGGGPGGDNSCVDVDGDGFAEDDPDASDNYCETRQFADALAAAGWTWEQDLWHWWEPDAPHAETAWAARVGMPLDSFLTLQ